MSCSRYIPKPYWTKRHDMANHASRITLIWLQTSSSTGHSTKLLKAKSNPANPSHKPQQQSQRPWKIRKGKTLNPKQSQATKSAAVLRIFQHSTRTPDNYPQADSQLTQLSFESGMHMRIVSWPDGVVHCSTTAGARSLFIISGLLRRSKGS